MAAIEESNDLNLLQLDELAGNLEVYEVIMERDDELGNVKKKRLKGIVLKTKPDNSPIHEKEVQIRSEEEDEFAMAVRNFQRFFKKDGRFNKPSYDEKKKSYEETKTNLKENVLSVVILTVWCSHFESHSLFDFHNPAKNIN